MKRVIASLKGYFNRYKMDILIFTVFTTGGLIFIQRPDLNHGLEQVDKIPPAKLSGQSEAKSSDNENYPSPIPLPQGEGARGRVTKVFTYEYLGNRNIFLPDGSYEPVKDLIRIPENPYNLIAVLKGKEKKAIFREFTGNVVSSKVGDKLIDGATILDIGDITVKVKKGRETKEFRIFEVKGAVLSRETKGERK
ncbi:MAG: hypothetical protein HY754_13035 [Nitrospirae bacterium]|nr:hypothetical protein [Nitrospirota bacterium]